MLVYMQLVLQKIQLKNSVRKDGAVYGLVRVGYQQPSHGPRVPFELGFICLLIYLFIFVYFAVVGIQPWPLHLLGKCLKWSHTSAPSTGFLWFKARSDHSSTPGTVLQSYLTHIGLLGGVHVHSASFSLAFTGRHTFAEVCLVFCPLSCGQPVRRKDNSSGELALLISTQKKIKTQGN